MKFQLHQYVTVCIKNLSFKSEMSNNKLFVWSIWVKIYSIWKHQANSNKLEIKENVQNSTF